MTLELSKFVSSLTWKQSKTNTGFTDTYQGSESKSFSVTPAVGTYNQIQLARYSIAAAGTQDVDLNSFTDLLGQAVTATKALTLFIKATGSGGQLRIAPHPSTNPVTWFFGGTTPTITLHCGTGGCLIALCDGNTHTINATQRSLRISNPGGSTITVDLVAVQGT